MRLRGSATASAKRFLELRARPVAVRPESQPVQPRRQIDRRPKHERMSITKAQIEALHAGAIRDRDRTFAAVCDRALRGEELAIIACKAAVYGLG